jgi:hypothetical protein
MIAGTFAFCAAVPTVSPTFPAVDPTVSPTAFSRPATPFEDCLDAELRGFVLRVCGRRAAGAERLPLRGVRLAAVRARVVERDLLPELREPEARRVVACAIPAPFLFPHPCVWYVTRVPMCRGFQSSG